jgi:hypothetical protein
MPSWVLLIPLLLLIAAAAVIIALERFRPNFGLAWLIALLASSITWGGLLFFHFHSPAPLQMGDWLPFLVNIDDRLLLQVDSVSWPLAFSLTTLLLAVILTAPVRLSQRSYPIAWASNLIITCMGLVGVLSGNLLTLLLVWSLIDIVELVVMLRTAHSPQSNRQVVFAFAMRLTGTMAALAAFVIGQSLSLEGENSAFPQANALLLVVAGLRLGVFPLNLPFTQEAQMRRGVGTLLRMASAATSLVLLARLTSMQLSPGWMSFLLFCIALTTLYAAGMWAGAANELSGRPYWIVALAGLALTCVVNDSPMYALIWSSMMIVSGGVLFLYSGRARLSIVLPLLAALTISGLPFTPAALGWSGLLGDTFTIFDVAMILVVALLMVGLLRHAMSAGEPTKDMQGWIQVAYLLGLFLLVGSGWLVAALAPANAYVPGNWPESMAAFLLVLGMSAIILQRRRLFQLEARLGWLDTTFRAIGHWLAVFFSLRWLYSLVQDLVELIRRFVEGLSLILEGEGGVLWAMVLLALLMTLLNLGVAK